MMQGPVRINFHGFPAATCPAAKAKDLMLLFLDFDGVLRRKHGSRLSFTVWCLISTTHRFGWLSCQSEAIFVCTNSRAGIQPRRVHALGGAAPTTDPAGGTVRPRCLERVVRASAVNAILCRCKRFCVPYKIVSQAA